VTYQIGALQAFAVSQGMKLRHVKPHGALYNMAVGNIEIWDAVAEAIGVKHGIRIAYEFFGDRAYNPDGSLVSRKLPGAVIHDDQQVADKVLKMVTEGSVICADGSEIQLAADTICVHGDNPAAVKLVKKIREILLTSGVEILPPSSFL
jgi:UPF0271 protein